MAWLGKWCGKSNTCGSVWSNRVGKNRETNEEHDMDCFKERFKLTRVKFDSDGEEGREALGMENCNINI